MHYASGENHLGADFHSLESHYQANGSVSVYVCVCACVCAHMCKCVGMVFGSLVSIPF